MTRSKLCENYQIGGMSVWQGFLLVGGAIGSGVAGILAGNEEGGARDVLVAISVLAGLAAVAGIVGPLLRRSRQDYQDIVRKRYLRIFETTIAPCLRLAHVDPASCIDKLDYVGQVINSVLKAYRYLQEKLLKPFL